MNRTLVLTCEHAGNEVPEAWKHLFRGGRAMLESHRGYDPGAWELFESLGNYVPCERFHSKVTRLLVELNRSSSHPRLFSEFTRSCTPGQKAQILANFYHPYRNQVTSLIRELTTRGNEVVHIGIHSFTPVLDGEIRQADIGLLYDPASATEKAFCRAWKSALKQRDTSLRIRMNYPYQGKSDGFITHLRRTFGHVAYTGIELEVSQKLLINPQRATEISKIIQNSLETILP